MKPSAKETFYYQLSYLLTILSLLFVRRSSVLMKFAVITKENQILRRTNEKHQITAAFTDHDRLFFLKLLQTNKKLKRYITLVKPETILKGWARLSKLRWFFSNSDKKNRGRPPITDAIRKLIIDIKKNNYSFGFRRVFGEILKLNIDTSVSTVRRVIQQGRKDGDIPPNGSWKRFIKSHIDSLFCCDFFTIETVFNRRLYVFFLMEMKTRKIVQHSVTAFPTMEFVRNQLKGFMFNRSGKKTHLIHDNSGELKWFDYRSVGIKDIAITPYSPNMNAHAERFVRSAKRECFDHFVIFNHRQLRNIMRAYVKYYNNLRPHQGIGNLIPDQKRCVASGRIRKESVLFGLYTNYSVSRNIPKPASGM